MVWQSALAGVRVVAFAVAGSVAAAVMMGVQSAEAEDYPTKCCLVAYNENPGVYQQACIRPCEATSCPNVGGWTSAYHDGACIDPNVPIDCFTYAETTTVTVVYYYCLSSMQDCDVPQVQCTGAATKTEEEGGHINCGGGLCP